MSNTTDVSQDEAGIMARLARTPDQVAAGVDPARPNIDATGKESVDFVPLTAAEMRGDTIYFTLRDMVLALKPLTRKQSRELAELIYGWPTIIRYAAGVAKETERVGNAFRFEYEGIDYPRTAQILNLAQANRHAKQEVDAEIEAAKTGQPFTPSPAPRTITPDDVASMMLDYEQIVEDYETTICNTVHLFTARTMPHLVWPPPVETDTLPEGKQLLSDFLAEHLRPGDEADLLRGLQLGNGNFRGCQIQRFTKP